MRCGYRMFGSLLMAGVVAVPVVSTGCATHHRVYDPYYRDYHAWNGEAVYYQQWETETHRDHRDFGQRSADEQKEYWTWRHRHADHEHDNH